jgi:hypothetical protein
VRTATRGRKRNSYDDNNIFLHNHKPISISRSATTVLRSYRGGGPSGSLFQDSYFDSLTAAPTVENGNNSKMDISSSSSSSSTSSSSFDIGFEALIEAATIQSKGTVLGGDFAGLAATFCPGSGDFIPLPEHLIPESLKEWGQEPKCLELLVSEDLRSMDGSSGDELTMIRVTTTILPDTGCSVDNLETIKAADEIDLTTGTLIQEKRWRLENDGETINDWDNNAVVALKYPLIGGNINNNNEFEKNELRLETIFGLSDGTQRHRLRVVLDLQIEYVADDVTSGDNNGVIIGVQKPMMVIMERRTSSISSGGTISDGGGLDGRTISLLLGERLRGSQTFVDTEPPLGQSYENNETGIRYVALPSNILLAYGWINDDTQWTIQIGHVAADGSSRRVVSRTFTETQDGQLDFEIDSWVEYLQQQQQQQQDREQQSAAVKQIR